LCGNASPEYDQVVSKKDRFGISCENILCANCGVVRLGERFDEESNATFYKYDYRDLYVGKELASKEFFEGQVVRGNALLKLFANRIGLDQIESVFEVGCGAGGIVYPFYKMGKSVSGCDYGDKYIEYGLSKGLNLYQGDVDFSKTNVNTQDLVVLSHVMEHFTTPVETLNNIIKLVVPGKYLIVEVPGILRIRSSYCDDPLFYFQNAHVFNFHEQFLKLFFESMGLVVIYSSEDCVFILQKPESWIEEAFTMEGVNFNGVASRVGGEIKKAYLQNKLRINPYLFKKKVSNSLRWLGLLEPVKNMLRKK
jgi:SAM-dependent methyltransferase